MGIARPASFLSMTTADLLATSTGVYTNCVRQPWRQRLTVYRRGFVFAALTTPVWCVVTFLLSHLSPDPLPFWPHSVALGTAISVGLMFATLRFGHWFCER